MILAQIIFGAEDSSSRDRDELRYTAESYLAALLKNGQIYGEYLCAWSNGRLTAYVMLARSDALADGHHSEWAGFAQTSVLESFGQSPQLKIIDDDVSQQFRPWQQSTFLYLFTHQFNAASPICCGDTGDPIPLYLIPVDQQIRQSLFAWACLYKHNDSIWLDSGALEMPAYKQLADPLSDLSMRGRELCVHIERATKIPTFYFMLRYWGRNQGEPVRPCPVCGGKWHSSDVAQDQSPFHQFHFRCEHCRLVSHCADSTEDERHARIGEFKTVRSPLL